MRGNSKILMALVVVMILAAPFASVADELGLPTDKTSGATYDLVRFDGVVYRITTEVECELFFTGSMMSIIFSASSLLKRGRRLFAW